MNINPPSAEAKYNWRDLLGWASLSSVFIMGVGVGVFITIGVYLYYLLFGCAFGWINCY